MSGHALSDPFDLDPVERRHLEVCDLCRVEVDELRQVVVLGRSLTYNEELVAPPAAVWQRISAQLDSEPESGKTGGDHAPDAAVAAADIGRAAEVVPLRPAKPRRRGWVLVGAAAAVGLVVGVLGAVEVLGGVDEPGAVVAESPLKPLPGKTGSGAADCEKTVPNCAWT